MSDLSRGMIFLVSGIGAIIAGEWLKRKLFKEKKNVT